MGLAQSEKMGLGSFNCLRLLYNVLGPIAPSTIPCPDPDPGQCESVIRDCKVEESRNFVKRLYIAYSLSVLDLTKNIN